MLKSIDAIKKVTLLSGGISSEDYLSRRSTSYIFEVLSNCNFKVEILDWKKEGSVELHNAPETKPLKKFNSLLECFSQYKTDIIFNCLHGEFENTGQIQGFFSIINIPLTGNQLSPSVIGMDKMLTKDLFKRMNIKTPEDLYIGNLNQIDIDRSIEKIRWCNFTYPIILKATHGGSSEGIAYIDSEEKYQAVINRWRDDSSRKQWPLFVEEYIAGEEYCAGVFGHWRSNNLEILPIAKIDHDGVIFDKTVKTNNSYHPNFNIDLPSTVYDKMKDQCLKLHRHLKFSGFSRVDFILDRDKNLYALEVNTHPGFSSHSIIPNMIREGDKREVKEYLLEMIEWALEESIYAS